MPESGGRLCARRRQQRGLLFRTFDGQGHTVSNLFIDFVTPVPKTILVDGYSTDGGVGLFGALAAGGVLRNVDLLGANVTGGDAMIVGTLTAGGYGVIDNVSASGSVTVGNGIPSVTAGALAGGLAGAISRGGSISNSHAGVTVTGGWTPSPAGSSARWTAGHRSRLFRLGIGQRRLQ